MADNMIAPNQVIIEELEAMRQALLSASGVLRQSSDPMAKQAAAILYEGVKKCGKIKA